MNHRIMALCPQAIYATFCDQYEVVPAAAVATPVFGHSLLKTMSLSPATVSIKTGAIAGRKPRLTYRYCPVRAERTFHPLAELDPDRRPRLHRQGEH